VAVVAQDPALVVVAVPDLALAAVGVVPDPASVVVAAAVEDHLVVAEMAAEAEVVEDAGNKLI